MAKADSAHSSFAAYAPILEMMREIKAEIAELRAELCGVQISETLTSRITPGAPVLGVASGSAHRVPPNAVGSRPSNNSSSSDEEENLSFSSSTIQQPAFDHSGKSSSGKPSDPHRSFTTVDLPLVSKSGKEAEEIKGIPPYPSIAEWGAWQRDVRYAVTSASSHPGAALDYVLSGESGIDPLELNADPNFETLGAKWAMSLRLIVRGELKRELSVLEEQILRTHHRLMDGRQIYSWINRKFQRDARLARPQILQELANCKIANTGFGALKDYLTRWDMCVERLIQAGAETSDREILYVYFKANFMASSELASGPVAKVKRSLPSSKVYSYEWMYAAARCVLESQQREAAEKERLQASLPGSVPLTPGVPINQEENAAAWKEQERVQAAAAEMLTAQRGKAGGKGDQSGNKPTKDTKGVGCPRLARGVECQYGPEGCYYSHGKAEVSKAKEKLEPGDHKKKKTGAGKGGERKCHFFAKGTCNNGDACEFSHAVPVFAGQSPAAATIAAAPSDLNSDGWDNWGVAMSVVPGSDRAAVNA